MIVKAPEDVKEYIKSKFYLENGEVLYKRNTNPQFGTCAKFNGNIYSKSYVKDVLEGRDPDLSVLFDKLDGKLFRNQDPVWDTRKGTEVTNNGAAICGAIVTNGGVSSLIFKKRSNLKHIALKRDTLVLEPLVASEYVQWCIKDRFRLQEGEVVYIEGDKPFSGYISIDNMRYSKSYMQQVLEGKDPDVSDLFELRDGVIYRSQDPIWGSFKGDPFKLAVICGAVFTGEGCVESEPEQSEPEPSGPEEYELLN